MGELSPFHSTSRLKLGGTDEEVVICCRGEGPTIRVVTGLFVWGSIAAIGLALLLVAFVAPLRASINWSSYFWTLGVLTLPVGIGITFGLQCFQLGWNDTVVAISRDRIRVHSEGTLAPSAYSFLFSEIANVEVQTSVLSGISTGFFGTCLFIRHRYKDCLLKVENKEELDWVKGVILDRMT